MVRATHRKDVNRTSHIFQVLGLAFLVGLETTACGGSQEPPVSPASGPAAAPELVDRSATAIEALRTDSDFRGIDEYLSRAHGVMIFPKLHKASFIVGGEGGDGVLLARTAGGWSAPAFYKLRAGSAGFQIGYQESTVVLAFMTASALKDVVEGGFTLGAGAAVAAGTIGDAAAQASTRPGVDVAQFVESGGVFAGASLNGSSITPKEGDNNRYYAHGASPQSIVVEQRFNPAWAQRLQNALPPPAR